MTTCLSSASRILLCANADRITPGLPHVAIIPQMRDHPRRPDPNPEIPTDPANSRDLQCLTDRRPGLDLATSRGTLSP